MNEEIKKIKKEFDYKFTDMSKTDKWIDYKDGNEFYPVVPSMVWQFIEFKLKEVDKERLADFCEWSDGNGFISQEYDARWIAEQYIKGLQKTAEYWSKKGGILKRN